MFISLCFFADTTTHSFPFRVSYLNTPFQFIRSRISISTPRKESLIPSSTKYPPALNGGCFLARRSTYVLANFADFAILHFSVYQNKKHPHIQYPTPFAVCTTFVTPYFSTLSSGLFSFSAGSLPQE